MATIRLSRTFRHLAVVTASGAQKNKLQRHSSVPMLSFDMRERLVPGPPYLSPRCACAISDREQPTGL